MMEEVDAANGELYPPSTLFFFTHYGLGLAGLENKKAGLNWNGDWRGGSRLLMSYDPIPHPVSIHLFPFFLCQFSYSLHVFLFFLPLFTHFQFFPFFYSFILLLLLYNTHPKQEPGSSFLWGEDGED